MRAGFALAVLLVLSCQVFGQDNSSQSLGDIARQQRAKLCKEEGKFCDKSQSGPTGNSRTVRVVSGQGDISDDSAAPVQSAGTMSDEEALDRFRLMDKEKLGRAVLTMAQADVAFPGRKNWEQALFDAKQEWMRQLDRAEAHQGTSTSSEEVHLAEAAEANFERVRSAGIESARDFQKSH